MLWDGNGCRFNIMISTTMKIILIESSCDQFIYFAADRNNLSYFSTGPAEQDFIVIWSNKLPRNHLIWNHISINNDALEMGSSEFL